MANLLALPIAAFCMFVLFVQGAGLLQRFQLFLAPGAPFFCTPTPVAALVAFLALFLFVVPIGLLLANLVLWTLPFARRALTPSGKDPGRSFRRAETRLARATLVCGLVAVPVCLVAINSEACISPTAVYERPWLLAPWQIYAFSEIAEVQPTCARGSRGGWTIGLDLVTTDGTVVELGYVEPWYSAAAGRILPLLRGLPVNASRVAPDCPANLKALVTDVGQAGQ